LATTACRRASRGAGICCRFQLCFINDHERRVIEVALLVGFGVDEEALGATFHTVTSGVHIGVMRSFRLTQNLKGFFSIRPVFLRIEPTFDSSFFGSAAGFGGVIDAWTVAFFAGNAADAFVVSRFVSNLGVTAAAFASAAGVGGGASWFVSAAGAEVAGFSGEIGIDTGAIVAPLILAGELEAR